MRIAKYNLDNIDDVEIAIKKEEIKLIKTKKTIEKFKKIITVLKDETLNETTRKEKIKQIEAQYDNA